MNVAWFEPTGGQLGKIHFLNGGGTRRHNNGTDYRCKVHLEFKFKPGPLNDSGEDGGGGGGSHRRALGINELQIEVERRGWSVKRGAKMLKLSPHAVGGVGGEEGRTQILQMTREEIRRKSQEFQQWYTVLWLTGIGDMCRNKRRAELLLDPWWWPYADLRKYPQEETSFQYRPLQKSWCFTELTTLEKLAWRR